MKVSDFKLAERFLRGVCSKYGVDFVDVPVLFDAAADVQDGSAIRVGETKRLGETLLSIVAHYIESIDAIAGRRVGIDDAQKEDLFVTATAIVRDFLHSDRSLPEAWDRPYHALGLTQFPLVWLTMRDLISPLYGCELKDVRVSIDKSPRHDAAVCGEVEVDGESAPVLFINAEVESDAYRSAFLLASAIRAHGLEPRTVVSDLLNDPSIRQRYRSFIRMVFVDDSSANEFLVSLAAAAGIQVDTSIESGNQGIWKGAQAGGGASLPGMGGGNWFAPMLIEGLLPGAHGSDPDIRKRLSALNRRLWERVAEEKKKRGKADLNLEELLRVQSRPLKTKPNVLIQELLSDSRIW